MLKFIVPEQEEYDKLSDQHKALYEEDGQGRWVLQVEGAVPKKQLDEFRTTNVTLRKQVEAYGDITPDLAKAAVAKKAEYEAGTDPKKIDELVNGRVAKMQEEHATALKGLQTENQGLKTQIGKTVIHSALTEAGTKAGVRPEAVADLIARGSSVFSLAEDGKTVQALDADGNPVYGTAGVALTPENYVKQLAKEAPHLFQTSTGGGSGGGGGGGQGGGGAGGQKGNPWAKETWNLTQQGLILRENRDKARQLASAAGVTIE